VDLHEGVRPEFFEPTRLRADDIGRDAAALGAAAHAERKRAARERDRWSRRIQAIQGELEACEGGLAELDEAMVAAATDFPRLRELGERRQQLDQQSAALYQEWEALEEQLAT
jgi:chromosome segregation ATPase